LNKVSLELYNYFRSSSSYRVRIALNLKGKDYSYLPVHLNRNGGEQFEPDFREMSPDAVVPVLVAGQDKLVQSLAIIEWLEEMDPTPPLLPSSAADRAWVRALCLTIACEVHPLNNLRVLKYLTGPLQLSEEAKTQWIHHWIHHGLSSVEQMLAGRDSATYCFGDLPGMADCFLVPQVFNAQRFGVDLSRYENILRIAHACDSLDAFAKAHPARQVDAE
jgi:maleylpyruvate isomerase